MGAEVRAHGLIGVDDGLGHGRAVGQIAREGHIAGPGIVALNGGLPERVAVADGAVILGFDVDFGGQVGIAVLHNDAQGKAVRGILGGKLP